MVIALLEVPIPFTSVVGPVVLLVLHSLALGILVARFVTDSREIDV